MKELVFAMSGVFIFSMVPVFFAAVRSALLSISPELVQARWSPAPNVMVLETHPIEDFQEEGVDSGFSWAEYPPQGGVQ